MSDKLQRSITRKMNQLGIREDDILETFTRSSGPGGQNVNKTSTRVHLRHLPTLLEVSCQRERSQALNRLLAREMLLEKIERQRACVSLQERSLQEKIKRQKRRRPRSLKERILETKRKQAEKKRMRSRIGWDAV
jgi:peptide chain release factor